MNNPHINRFFGGEVDWFTVLLWLLLCVIGWFNIHAAVFDPEHPGLFSMETNYGKQPIYIFSALLLAVVILIVDAKFYSRSEERREGHVWVSTCRSRGGA